ncbi:MAG: hypothetical protein ACTS3F_11300 [Phycisphaerales bacterium]
MNFAHPMVQDYLTQEELDDYISIFGQVTDPLAIDRIVRKCNDAMQNKPGSEGDPAGTIDIPPYAGTISLKDRKDSLACVRHYMAERGIRPLSILHAEDLCVRDIDDAHEFAAITLLSQHSIHANMPTRIAYDADALLQLAGDVAEQGGSLSFEAGQFALGQRSLFHQIAIQSFESAKFGIDLWGDSDSIGKFRGESHVPTFSPIEAAESLFFVSLQADLDDPPDARYRLRWFKDRLSRITHWMLKNEECLDSFAIYISFRLMSLPPHSYVVLRDIQLLRDTIPDPIRPSICYVSFDCQFSA